MNRVYEQAKAQLRDSGKLEEEEKKENVFSKMSRSKSILEQLDPKSQKELESATKFINSCIIERISTEEKFVHVKEFEKQVNDMTEKRFNENFTREKIQDMIKSKQANSIAS